MAGRPKRHLNQDLRDRLETARLKAGLSISELARKMGVNPTTLWRSIVLKSFSSNLAATAELALREGLRPAPKNRSREEETPDQTARAEETLLLLQKLIKVAPELELALKSLIERKRPIRRQIRKPR